MDTKCGGRKNLLLVASGIVLIAHVWTANVSSPTAGKMCLLIYLFGWQLAWGSVCWIIPSELFSMAEKGPAMAVPTFVLFAMNPVAAQVASQIMSVNFSAFFYVAAALMVLHIIFIVTCVRETKGVPMEKIPALYGATTQA